MEGETIQKIDSRLRAEWSEEGDSKEVGILRGVSAVTSIIASSTVIWMILRSQVGLSTTQHRLLFGICVADIVLSVSFSSFNMVVPSEISYWVWNARGNQTTCTAQGFLTAFGGSTSVFYSCSLNVYYLAVVKYDKTDEYIRKKLEPFLHGIPVTLSLAFSIYGLASENFNSNAYGTCFFPFYDPPHCDGYEDHDVPPGFDIPCGRGRDGSRSAEILLLIGIIFPPIFVGCSLGVIYRVVKKIEKKSARYGVGSLQTLSGQYISGNSNIVDNRQEGRPSGGFAVIMWGRFKKCFTRTECSASEERSTAISMSSKRSIHSQRQAVLYKALAYSISYFMTFAWHIISCVFLTTVKTYPPSLSYLANVLGPLQGLWNFLIFIHPKVMHARKSKRNNVSWCEAFRKALKSRGSIVVARKRGAGRTRRTNLRDNKRQRLKGRGLKSGEQYQKKKKRKHRSCPPREEEEEKCELQASYNAQLNSSQYSNGRQTSSVTFAQNISENASKVSHNVGTHHL